MSNKTKTKALPVPEIEHKNKVELLKLPDYEFVGRHGGFGYYEDYKAYSATTENITKLFEKLNEVIDYINTQ